LLPKTENGDILMVYATGAYNYSMASNYNNMLKPAVVFIDNQPKLVARRETLDDLLKLFK
jgi:diaminopimelate decarboxylase